MKRLLALLLVLMMFVPGAMAMELGEGLDMQILKSSWESIPASDTHTRLVLDVQLTNWMIQDVNIAQDINVELTFMEKYSFTGETGFEAQVISPLVQLNGSVCFELPNMITQAPPEALELTLQFRDERKGVSFAPNAAVRSGRFEGPGFDSADEAAMAYVQALKDGDAMAAISTFAIESYVENGSFEAYCKWLKVFNILGSGMLIPSDNDYFNQVKAAQRLNDVSTHMFYNYVYSFWDEETYGDFLSPIRLNEENSYEAFRQMLADGEKTICLDSIENIRIAALAELGSAVMDYYLSDAGKKTRDNRAAAYGCDEFTDRAVRFTMDGREYMQFLSCVRYGDKWYNFSQSSLLGTYLNVSPYAGGMAACDEIF